MAHNSRYSWWWGGQGSRGEGGVGRGGGGEFKASGQAASAFRKKKATRVYAQLTSPLCTVLDPSLGNDATQGRQVLPHQLN